MTLQNLPGRPPPVRRATSQRPVLLRTGVPSPEPSLTAWTSRLTSRLHRFVPGYNHLDVGTDTSYAVTGLTPATSYYYETRAVNGGGEGAASNVTLVTTVANAPAAPTANLPTGVSATGFTANWSSVSGATSYLP